MTGSRRLPVLDPPDHWRPTHRGDCLTAARRDEVEQIYGHRTATGTPVAEESRAGSPIDGRNAQRPCLYAGCKYHLALDYNVHTGEVTPTREVSDEELVDNMTGKVVVPDPDQYHPAAYTMHTCALDIADVAREDGSVTLEDVGKAVDKTRERIRQVSDRGMASLKPYLGTIAARDGEDVRLENGVPLSPDSVNRVRLANDSQLVVLQARMNTLVVPCQGCERAVTVRRSSLLTRTNVLCRVCSRK